MYLKPTRLSRFKGGDLNSIAGHKKNGGDVEFNTFYNAPIG